MDMGAQQSTTTHCLLAAFVLQVGPVIKAVGDIRVAAASQKCSPGAGQHDRPLPFAQQQKPQHNNLAAAWPKLAEVAAASRRASARGSALTSCTCEARCLQSLAQPP